MVRAWRRRVLLVMAKGGRVAARLARISQAARMHSGDVGVTLEVLRVQCQQMSDAVNAHGGGTAGIMHLHARDGVS